MSSICIFFDVSPTKQHLQVALDLINILLVRTDYLSIVSIYELPMSFRETVNKSKINIIEYELFQGADNYNLTKVSDYISSES